AAAHAQPPSWRQRRREGLHPDRAPRRHPDHRHPRRDRPADLPRSAEEGPGRLGQERCAQRGHPGRVLPGRRHHRHRRRLRHRCRQPGTGCAGHRRRRHGLDADQRRAGLQHRGDLEVRQQVQHQQGRERLGDLHLHAERRQVGRELVLWNGHDGL
ncbi:MAG: hypothetical protein AVDCRST_MAG53-1379, partial [uncultured Solirubrobacteraceae bacterium]